MTLDKTDRAILAILQNDASITNAELAERINLSPTPCARRVKQLEDAGIIQRRVTVIDPEKVGINLTAWVSITMRSHHNDRFNLFEHEARELPEVMECYIVTGQDSDFLLKVLVRDMRHYEEFLLRRLTKIEGVTGVHTSFVLRQPIQKYEVPIA